MAVVLAAEARYVEIRIMWLAPVPARPPQHASRRARRTPLKDVVLSLEEIRRVSGIKRYLRESGKRFEFRARPVPAVAHRILNAKSARPARIRTHRARIPMRKIKIPVPRFRRFLAPRVASLHFRIRSTVRRAMKLLLGWQLAPQPLRARRGLRVAHVHRPVHGKTDLSKHRATQPQISRAPPKSRMLPALFFLPSPRFLAPQRPLLISPALDAQHDPPVAHL